MDALGLDMRKHISLIDTDKGECRSSFPSRMTDCLFWSPIIKYLKSQRNRANTYWGLDIR